MAVYFGRALQSGTKRIRNAHFQCPNPPEHVRSLPTLRRAAPAAHCTTYRPFDPYETRPFHPPSLRSASSAGAFNLNVNPDLKFRGALSRNDVPFNSSGSGKGREGRRQSGTIQFGILYGSGGEGCFCTARMAFFRKGKIFFLFEVYQNSVKIPVLSC